MAKIPKVTVTFDADLDSLKKGVKGATTEVDSFGTKVGNFSKKAALAFAAVAAAAAGMAIKIGVDAVKAASDLSETVSKVNVLFGETAKDIEDFADGAASALGQTKKQALDAAATFATFGKAAGLSGKDLSGFSTDFVKLASDLASFNNTSPEQAINAIGSALRGEAEPLRAYGVLLDDASLRQAALKLGIISTTKDALTPQQKVLAAQALIYEQTSAAQGDFERTSDGLANKTRILTAQLENAKTTIGAALLPIVLELATLFSEKVIPIVERVADAFGSKTTGMNGVLQNLSDLIRNLVQPILEGLKSAFDKIKSSLSDNSAELQPFYDALYKVWDFVKKYLAPLLGGTFKLALEAIGSIVAGLVNGFSRLVGFISSTVSKIKEFVNFIKDNPVTRFFFGDSNDKSLKVGTGFDAGSTMDTDTGAGGGGGGGAFTTPTFLGGNDPRTFTGAPLEAFSPGMQAAILRREELKAETARLREARATGAAARTAATGGLSTAERITINVNAPSIIDEEGFTRALNNAQNNSFFRGTGGATNLVGI